MAPLTVPINGFDYSLDQMRAIEADTLPRLAPTDNGAIVAAVTATGVRTAIEFGHTDRGWSADVAYEHDWNGGNYGAGEVMYRW